MKDHAQIKFGGYVFTPGESFFGRFVWRILNSSMRDWVGAVLLALLCVGLFVFTGLTSVDIFFWMFFVSMFFWNIDSRVSIGGALVCLVAIPMLLVANNNLGFASGEAWAETVAVWAYFFLVIGVVKQIWEFKRESIQPKAGPPWAEKS